MSIHVQILLMPQGPAQIPPSPGSLPCLPPAGNDFVFLTSLREHFTSYFSCEIVHFQAFMIVINKSIFYLLGAACRSPFLTLPPPLSSPSNLHFAAFYLTLHCPSTGNLFTSIVCPNLFAPEVLYNHHCLSDCPTIHELFNDGCDLRLCS